MMATREADPLLVVGKILFFLLISFLVIKYAL